MSTMPSPAKGVTAERPVASIESSGLSTQVLEASSTRWARMPAFAQISRRSAFIRLGLP